MGCSCACTCGWKKDKIRTGTTWSEQKIIICVKALLEAGIPIDYSNLKKDRSEKTRSILKKAIGRDVSAHSVYKAAVYRRLSWKQVALAAGATQTQTLGRKQFWTRSLLLESVNALHRAKIPLNAKEICKDRSKQTLKILFDVTGVETTGKGLYRTSEKTFGSWQECLRIAGLDPNQIKFKRQKRPKKSNICLMPYQIERIQESNGMVRYVRQYGLSPTTPEDIALNKGFLLDLEIFFGRYPSSVRILSEEIMEMILLDDFSMNEAIYEIEKSGRKIENNLRLELIETFRDLQIHLCV